MVLKTALWVIPVSALGGVARHALDVARVGIPGWRVLFLAPPGPLTDRLRELGADVVTAEFGPEYGLASSVRSLRSAVSETGADLVHSHLSYADVVAALATPRRAALVTTEHGIADDDLVYHGSTLRSRAMALLHSVRLRRFDAVIAVSRATAAAIRRKWHPGPRPIEVLPNGVDPYSATDPRPPGLRVLSLARLAPEKRIAELVTGFAELHATRPEATLALAGAGDLRDQLAGQIRALGLDDAVTLPGHVDPVAAMREADVLAQLSVFENCSYSILDALAHGLGVVASPVGGNPEILPERCLVDPGSPGRVATALLEQGLAPADRPSLPDGWPTVATMTERISQVYGGLR